jgi:DNA-directed RNA polymerase sigma subunit (sigma70/sigma32)
MVSSALPLFPTDDGWPYPDADPIPLGEVGDEIDLDDLELRADVHAFDDLTELEHAVLVRRFGLDRGPALSMKELGPALGCSRSDARLALGSAIDKLRGRLLA